MVADAHEGLKDEQPSARRSPRRDDDTAPGYRPNVLPDTEQAKPGLVGGGPTDGPGIGLEVRELARASVGLVAGVPSPLAIGAVVLKDGRAVKGSLCAGGRGRRAPDITEFGDRRAYRASLGSARAAPVG